MASEFVPQKPITRTAAKAARKEALLQAAAKLFAATGFTGVSLEDIGRAVGVSGPAIYRHFSGKQDLLLAILMGASEELLAGATEIIEPRGSTVSAKAETTAATEEATMRDLVAFHVDYALAHPEVITVQVREMANLLPADIKKISSLQRSYIGVWITALTKLAPHAQFTADDPEELRLRVQATFGLLNSTPHATDSRTRALPQTRAVLETLAFAALTVPA